MFCWLVMPPPRLVSVARLVLFSLVLLEGFCHFKHVCQGGEEAAACISLLSAYWCGLLCMQLSTEGMSARGAPRKCSTACASLP